MKIEPQQSLLFKIGHFLSLLPFVYVFVVLYFVPDGDDFLKWPVFLAVIPGIIYRKKVAGWRMDEHRAFILPLLFYSLLLLLSYLLQGGFMSMVKAYLFPLFFFYLCYPLLQNIDKLKYLFIASGFGLAVFTYYQNSILKMPRVGGFTNPIFFGTFAFCVALVCLYLSGSVRSLWLKLLFWCAVIFALYAAVLSSSRGVWLALIPVLGVYLVYLYRVTRKPLMAVTATIVVIAIFFVFNANRLVPRVQLAYKNTYEYYSVISEGSDMVKDNIYRTSAGIRLAMWEFSLLAFKESPIWGLGRKGVEEAKERYVNAGMSPPIILMYKKGHVHNQYLQELLMRGLIGFLALLALFIGPGREAVRRIKNNHWTGYAILSLALSFAVFSITEATLRHPYKIYVYLYLMAYLFCCLPGVKSCAVQNSAQ